MRQSLRMLMRDWRAGELQVLAAALVVAVASVTSVAFFADRVGQALARDAHQLLGADLVLASDHPWDKAIGAQITQRGLARAEALNFISMASKGEGDARRSKLAGVKAVSDNYPLRGKLRTAPAPGAPDAPAARGPAPGSVWLDGIVLALVLARLARPLGRQRAPYGPSRGHVPAQIAGQTQRGPGLDRRGARRHQPLELLARLQRPHHMDADPVIAEKDISESEDQRMGRCDIGLHDGPGN